MGSHFIEFEKNKDKKEVKTYIIFIYYIDLAKGKNCLMALYPKQTDKKTNKQTCSWKYLHLRTIIKIQIRS